MSPTGLTQHVSTLVLLVFMGLSKSHYAQQSCKTMMCPKTPEKCVVVSPQQRDSYGCLTKCGVLKCEPGVYSQDWKKVAEKLFKIVRTDDAIKEGLKDGLIVWPEVKSFPVPEGTYEFLDPV